MNQILHTADDSALIAKPAGNLGAGALRSAPEGNKISVSHVSWRLKPTFFSDISNRSLGDIVRRRKPITLPETATVQEACCIMRDRPVGAIPVIGQDGRLIGLFTGRDAVCRVAAEGLDPATTLLCAVMTLEPESLRPEKRPIDALRMMNAGGFRHLPIVDGWRLVGIVSLGDLAARQGHPVSVSEAPYSMHPPKGRPVPVMAPTNGQPGMSLRMNGPGSEHKERLERFVCRENVARFRRLLTTESDEAERDMLCRLLIEEQENPAAEAVEAAVTRRLG
jgi:CBS domain-containing protein